MRLAPLLSATALAVLTFTSCAVFAQSTEGFAASAPVAESPSSGSTALPETAAFGGQTGATHEDLSALPAQFDSIVSRRLAATPEVFEKYASLASTSLQSNKSELAHDQFVVVVDRNPNVQAALLYVMGPGGVTAVGATPVSTGRTGQKDHFITPVGVFANTLDNPSFRALGTKNEVGFRGYGAKGMRIWDFGWQTAEKGWGKPEPRQIRFEMHATDPALAEPLLGTRRSQGCVRLSAGFNKFLDSYGALDENYLNAEAEGKNMWVLPKERVQNDLHGQYLVVVDSGEPTRPGWVKPQAH